MPAGACMCSSCSVLFIYTSVNIIKNEVGMTPCQKLLKQEGTARWIESMQQSSATPKTEI